MKRAYGRWAPSGVIIVVLAAAMLFGPSLAHRIAYAVAAGQAQVNREQLVELSKADTLSPLFRAVTEVVQPAVVEIRVTKRVQVGNTDMDEMLRRFFEDSPFAVPPGSTPSPPSRPREYFARGLGSGVVVDAENGYVVTNYHVVGGADEVEVILSDGRTFKAEWVRTDVETDLAVVKISAGDLVEAPLGDSDTVAVGDWVLAFGSPKGLERTVTAGIVSAKAREYGGLTVYQNAIQTDAAINRGNSGGPLVNTRGEVIGINNAIASASGGNEGIGFAIASDVVRSVMEQLIANGKVARGYMGVVLQDIDPRLAESFNLPHTRGALIAEVQPGSPAAEAGFEPGDFVVAVEGKAVTDRAELQRIVAAIPPGRAISVSIIRDGDEQTLKLTLGTRPDLLTRGRAPDEPEAPTGSVYGLNVQTLTPEIARRLGYAEDVAGVVATAVDSASDAAEEGLRAGMVITHVGDRAVGSATEFTEALADAGEKDVRLRVRLPRGRSQFVVISPMR